MDLMVEANEKGSPVTRPLLLHWPESDTARSIDSQFMLGENILMAPAFGANITEREVFLPGSEVWLNLWTK
jgi:alpha-glucosidase (family GH31 glycosyl hydrolase)